MLLLHRMAGWMITPSVLIATAFLLSVGAAGHYILHLAQANPGMYGGRSPRSDLRKL
jgi:hypothetical protein